MANRHAPIQHTCPDIDKYIKSIKWAIVKDSSLKNLNESDLFDAASTMCSELESCIEYLEDLRQSNGALRDWGHELVEDIEELERRLSDSEDEVSRLREQIKV